MLYKQNQNSYVKVDLSSNNLTTMNLNIIRTNNTLKLSGRLDAESTPQFEAEIDSAIDNADSLVLDMSALEYISSAGLRVILKAHKVLSKKEGLTLTNVPKTIENIFEITGFSDFLSFKSIKEKPANTYYRRMTVSDVPAVKALIEKGIADDKVQLIYEDFECNAWFDGYDLDYLTTVAEHYHAYLMFEDQSDSLVASGYIKLQDDGKSAYVGMLFSDPAYRHLKLGSKMLAILENDSYAQTTKKIVLNASMSAFRFYQKMGYKFLNGEFEMVQVEDDTYGVDLVKNL